MAFQIFPDSLHSKFSEAEVALNQRDAELAKKIGKQPRRKSEEIRPRGYAEIRHSVYGLWRILCTATNICGFNDFQELCWYQGNLEVPSVSL